LINLSIKSFRLISFGTSSLILLQKIKKTYYTDLNGDIIEKGNIGQEVYLVVEGVNLAGKEADLDLTDNETDFEYNGERLENDILKGYIFQNNEIEHIKLKIVEQKNN